MILTKFLYFCFLLKATNARAFRVSQTQALSIAERASADNILNPGLSEASLPSQPQTISFNNPTSLAFVPSPVQSGISSSCKSYYLVQNGDYCDSIVSKFHNFTLNEFYTWNPAVKPDCSELLSGYYVCVGTSLTTPVACQESTATGLEARSNPTPTPTQAGIARNCNDFYEVVSGDTCLGIANGYKITLSQFYTWNPAVGSQCQLLLAGYYVCVGVPGTYIVASTSAIPTCPGSTASMPTETPTPTPTATSVPAPAPTQPGIASDCIQYYEAQAGDTCIGIVQKYSTSLTLSQFEAWNPAVGNDCTNLLSGYYYCIATVNGHA